jgi:hypothetical protein
MSDSILSEHLWRRIEPLLPKLKKRRNVQHAGRKPADARQVMTGIMKAVDEINARHGRDTIRFGRRQPEAGGRRSSCAARSATLPGLKKCSESPANL